MTPALKGPSIVSARALSRLSPTLPAEGALPASPSLSAYLMDRYWAVSTGRRNAGILRLVQ